MSAINFIGHAIFLIVFTSKKITKTETKSSADSAQKYTTYVNMISSNNLYHFTSKFEYLKAVLDSKKLRVSYCLEDFTWLNDYGIEFDTIWGKASERNKISIAVPMTCFCDIPSNLIHYHTKVYGEFGIGFNIKFKESLALNPLFYIVKQSSAATLLQTMKVLVDKLSSSTPQYAIKNQTDKFLPYCKPYNGFFKKGEYENKQHKFYDEREWRYVVPNIIHPPLSEIEFNKLTNKCVDTLDFSLEDISVIVVSKQIEKDELLKYFTGINIETLEEFSISKK